MPHFFCSICRKEIETLVKYCKLIIYLVLVENDKRSFLHDTFPVPHLSLAGPEPLGFVDLFDVRISLALLQEDMGFLGLGVRLDFVGDDEGQFGGMVHPVAFGHDEGRHASGCNS